MFWQQDLKLETVGSRAVIRALGLSNPVLGNLSDCKLLS